MEYVRTLVPTMLALFGADETRALLGRTARLIGMQFYDETAALLDVAPGTPQTFAHYLAALAAAQGESVETGAQDGDAIVRQRGWKLMQGLDPIDQAAFEGWNALWEGALSAHNRHLTLRAVRVGSDIEWRIATPKTGW